MNDQQDQFDLNLPGKLSADLKGLCGQTPTVPQHIDDAILNAAGHRLRNQRRYRVMLRWAGAASAAAAMLLLAIWIMPQGSAPQQARRGDILDAFQVARAITHHESLKKEWDMNGDGMVNQTDVDLMAQQAVSLKQRPQS